MTPQNKIPAIALLQDRKARLGHKPFDWNAWKKGTLLVLNSLFGEESYYFRELSAIDYQYSSWSLRDTSGSGDPVKASCAELLDICMVEVQHQQPNLASTRQLLETVLKKYLSQSLLEQIRETLGKDVPPFEKEEQVVNLIQQTDSRTVHKILAELITSLMKP